MIGRRQGHCEGEKGKEGDWDPEVRARGDDLEVVVPGPLPHIASTYIHAYVLRPKEKLSPYIFWFHRLGVHEGDVDAGQYHILADLPRRMTAWKEGKRNVGNHMLLSPFYFTYYIFYRHSTQNLAK